MFDSKELTMIKALAESSRELANDVDRLVHLSEKDEIDAKLENYLEIIGIQASVITRLQHIVATTF